MTPHEPTGNLPAELSSFIGRQRDVAEAKKALSRARLVTLTGVGGVGKTRLALRVAAQLRRAFPDGVWLAGLSSLPDPTLLSQAVADSLDIRDHGPRTPLETVIDHLQGKRLLLVLDNCEHLVDDCARLSTRLLAMLPSLRVLATSRHALGLDDEWPLTVRPLPLPGAESGDLLANESVRLFIERARPVSQGPDLTQATTAAVIARICQRLDGLPLAIELAAARMRVLSPQQVLDRLDDRFRLLTMGSRSAPARQQTLWDAIAWSYGLCSAAERLVWTRASELAEEFGFDAAEAVCCGDGVSRAQLRSLLAGLADKSVLALSERGTTTRYRMLDTLRQFGKAQITGEGELSAIRRRHRDYCWRLARLTEQTWFGSAQLALSGQLRREHANMRLALDFCCTESGEETIGLGIAAALWTYWGPCGALDEGRHWLTRLLAAAPEPTPMRAKALWVAGWVTQLHGDIAGAVAALAESRALAEKLGYQRAIAYALHYSARAAMSEGHYEPALRLFSEALARHRALGDRMGVATLLPRLALCYCLRNDEKHGDLDLAVALTEECMRRCEAVQEIWCLSSARYVHGLASWASGRHQEAAESAEMSLRLKRKLHDEPGVALNLELLAWISATTGRSERAAHLLGAAAKVWGAVGAPFSGIKPLLEFHEHAVRRTREELGVPRCQGAYESGFQASPEQILGEASASTASLLTEREQVVADLVAQGLTNKEIAAELEISLRTAETHVQHIFAKLGVTTRAELAGQITARACQAGF